jgi:hypothetical protein
MSRGKQDEAKSKKPKTVKGRPPKLTQELQDQIVQYIKVGAYIETAAAACGLNKSTFYDWLKRGARAQQKGEWPEEEQKYVDFSNAIEKATADAELRDVGLIARAAQTTWQAAAWRLERKFPHRWGRYERHDVEMQGQHAVVSHDVKDEKAFEREVAKFFNRQDEIIEDEEDEDEEDENAGLGDFR